MELHNKLRHSAKFKVKSHFEQIHFQEFLRCLHIEAVTFLIISMEITRNFYMVSFKRLKNIYFNIFFLK